MPILNLLSRRKQRSKLVTPILNLLSRRKQRSSTPTISKSHLHDGKRPSGKETTTLAQIKVGACEALTLQIPSLDAQQGIVAETLQLTRGTILETYMEQDFAFPSMLEWEQGRYLAVVETQKCVSSIRDFSQSSGGPGFDKALRLVNDPTASL